MKRKKSKKSKVKRRERKHMPQRATLTCQTARDVPAGDFAREEAKARFGPDSEWRVEVRMCSVRCSRRSVYGTFGKTVVGLKPQRRDR